jgi:hypothetical protein
MDIPKILYPFIKSFPVVCQYFDVYKPSDGLVSAVCGGSCDICCLYSIKDGLQYFQFSFLYFVWRLLRSEADSFFVWGIPTHMIRNIYLAGSVLVFYFSCALEINDQFTHRFNGTGLQFIYLQLFLVVFILFIWNGSQRLRITVNKYLLLSFPLLVLVMYVLNINNVYRVETRILVKGEFREYFLASWLSALFTLILIWQVIGFIRKNNVSLNWFLPQITCIIAISTLILFSAETRNLFIWLNYSGPNSIMRAEANFNKAGLTIVWGFLPLL